MAMVAERCLAAARRIAMQGRTTGPTLASARVFPWARLATAEGLDIPWWAVGSKSRSRRHGHERLRAAGLGFVGFRQLSGAGARDFGVRFLTARQCGPPALFHKGSCWIPGSWIGRGHPTALLSPLPPWSPSFSMVLKRQCTSRTTLELTTPESNKSVETHRDCNQRRQDHIMVHGPFW
jgi:hypothetical protein